MANAYDLIIIVGILFGIAPVLTYVKERLNSEIKGFQRKKLQEDHDTEMLKLRLNHEKALIPARLRMEADIEKAGIEQRRLAVEALLEAQRQKYDHLAKQTALPSSETTSNLPSLEQLTKDAGIEYKTLSQSAQQAYYESFLAKYNKSWKDYENYCKKQRINIKNVMNADTISDYLSDISNELVQVPKFADQLVD